MYSACKVKQITLHVLSMSEIALRLRLAVWMMSSCRAELPAATALAVAMVMPLVMRMNSSGVVVLLGASLDWNTWGGQGGFVSFGVIGRLIKKKLKIDPLYMKTNQCLLLLCSQSAKVLFLNHPRHHSASSDNLILRPKSIRPHR